MCLSRSHTVKHMQWKSRWVSFTKKERKKKCDLQLLWWYLHQDTTQNKCSNARQEHLRKIKQIKHSFWSNVPQRSWWCRVHHKTIQSKYINVHPRDQLTTSLQNNDNVKNTDLHGHRKDTWRYTSISTTIGFWGPLASPSENLNITGPRRTYFAHTGRRPVKLQQITQDNGNHDNRDFGGQRPSSVMAVDMYHETTQPNYNNAHDNQPLGRAHPSVIMVVRCSSPDETEQI